VFSHGCWVGEASPVLKAEGLTVMPYVNQQGRMAYSCKATGMRAARPATLSNAKEGGPKDAE
jgi:hypothetical protein